MAMLPIFLIGVVVGIALCYAFIKYKEDVPSMVKIERQQRELHQLQEDNDLLMSINEKLHKEIDELKIQLHIK